MSIAKKTEHLSGGIFMVIVDLGKEIKDPVIQKCISFIKEMGGADIALGKHFLENSDIYVNVSEYTTKQLEDSKWEAHKKYADLQVLLYGEELIYVADLKDTKIGNYREEKDFLECSTEQGEAVKVDKDTCVLLLPEDAHMPNVCIDRQPMAVKKAVCKIPVHYFA